MKINEFKIDLNIDDDPEPLPDVAICSSCDWVGKLSKCEIIEDIEYETGFKEIHIICPYCEDGGDIDPCNLKMSDSQSKKWDKWYKRNKDKI